MYWVFAFGAGIGANGNQLRAWTHANGCVGNRLAYLLTDGETVNGMGELPVRELYWETLQLMPVDPDYNDLYQLLLDAADNLGMSPAEVSNIQNGCEAVEID